MGALFLEVFLQYSCNNCFPHIFTSCSDPFCDDIPTDSLMVIFVKTRGDDENGFCDS